MYNESSAVRCGVPASTALLFPLSLLLRWQDVWVPLYSNLRTVSYGVSCDCPTVHCDLQAKTLHPPTSSTSRESSTSPLAPLPRSRADRSPKSFLSSLVCHTRHFEFIHVELKETNEGDRSSRDQSHRVGLLCEESVLHRSMVVRSNEIQSISANDDAVHLDAGT